MRAWLASLPAARFASLACYTSPALTAWPTLPAADWNISRCELANLVDFGLLSHAELASCIMSTWASVQVSLYGSEPVNCGGDILDCGVSPK